VCVAGVSLCALASPASAALPLWTTYHRDAQRTGVDPDSSSPLSPSQLWRTRVLDGQIYGEPLVYGSRMYVATQNDSVYALSAATGAVLWRRNVGRPVPDFQTTKIGCGNIGNVGITSTPVIDVASKRIFAVANTWDGHHVRSIEHRLVGFGLADGAPVPGLPRSVEPPGSNRAYQLQRTGLALDRGRVIIGYGGDSGDCGTYHGWLVSASESGRGPLRIFEAAPRALGGSIWGGGEGPVVDPSGDILVAISNGFLPFYDGQQSVLRLSAELKPLDHWTPANWRALDVQDFDIGTSEPLLLPGGLLFQIGKAGEGYLLSSSHLGGTAASPLFQAHVCDGPAFGAPVYLAGVIYVPCFVNHMRALSLNPQANSFAPLATWQPLSGAIGPPILAGGLVWSATWTNGILYGLDPSTGAITFQTNLGTFDHFATPTAAGGRLFIANGNTVTAFQIARPPAPNPTATTVRASAKNPPAGRIVTLTATVRPAPDAGTVFFTDRGARIRGCGSVAINISSGRAGCRTSYSRPGSHRIVARYSGDPYYRGSKSSTLTQMVRVR
jgi:outer membrane protein assembly factor BamB